MCYTLYIIKNLHSVSMPKSSRRTKSSKCYVTKFDVGGYALKHIKYGENIEV